MKLEMLFHLSFSHGVSSSHNLFVCSLCIFPTADDINLLIRIAVAYRMAVADSRAGAKLCYPGQDY